MRSRYTAYRNGNVDYLIATRHAKHRQAGDRATLLQTMQTTCWVGLTILKTQKGQATDKRGVVEFVALYRTLQHQTTQTQTTQNRIIQIPNGQAADLQKENPVHQLHERSRFIQESGQWFYVDGDLLPPVKRTLF
jgi:SEC-C motif-containing protein